MPTKHPEASSRPPLKVGVIGLGVGRDHIKAYHSLAAQAEVTAICDANQTRLDRVGDAYNIRRRYTDIERLLASGQVEAVSICLPNHLHAPVSIAALERGLHVLCEKPLADTVPAGRRVVEAAAGAVAKFMICFNRRYRPDIQLMKQLIEAERLGPIYQVNAGWIRETGIPVGWFATKEIAGGGALIDLGVHILDAVLWCLDYPAPLTVSGAVRTHFGPLRLKTWGRGNPTFDVEDSATAFIRLAGGVTVNLETTWASHARPGLDDFFITLQGTTGSLALHVANYATENTITLYTEENGRPTTSRPPVKGLALDHTYAVAEFVRCIQEDREPPATAEQGQAGLEIIEAIYRSAALEREVVFAG